ncbi:hypothetical protein ACN1OJ_000004 [Providencia stuartii]|uniref:hypothetical protein n=1 Tax=Providencia alcalifaciens TaxID=126385 RepID=UPI002EE9BEF2
MELVINVTQEELLEMDMNENELIVSVIMALDNHRDYVGYGVSVVIDDDGVVY